MPTPSTPTQAELARQLRELARQLCMLLENAIVRQDAIHALADIIRAWLAGAGGTMFLQIPHRDRKPKPELVDIHYCTERIPRLALGA